ncbi:hypothetical protein PHISCL_05361 [Aspergillus sclerotialis]|uniref:Uncharacterized protein n=1 Tax=Aspergillus sclerotialis TaxID=2070753 RepID=A0A3A2ZLQ9_9EURO|nr:hypothetical protein PHISCL_05361 [Aspergillus sclerotialis]
MDDKPRPPLNPGTPNLRVSHPRQPQRMAALPPNPYSGSYAVSLNGYQHHHTGKFAATAMIL